MPFWTKINGRIQCLVCPHNCKIAEGKTGICGVRKNNGREIELTTYGVVSGYSLDPVEKKPLYHFYPDHNILSIGSFGCNMRCDFCQNYHISQNTGSDLRKKFSPEELVIEALAAKKNIGLAFTYNEPTIWFEYIRDVAMTVRNAGFKTVLVSNGYVNEDPLGEILTFTDAFNIDLKAFNNFSYKTLTGASLEPVKRSLRQIAASGRHLEVTSLIIPGHNDKPGEMEAQADWIAGELGKGIPLHLSRYYPMYKRDDPATPQETLDRLYEIASARLDHVYMGNTRSGNGHDTKCPGCKKIVTERSGYHTRILNLDQLGSCLNCGTNVYSDFTFSLTREH